MATSDGTAKKQVQDRSNFIVRSITALVAGPLVLIVVYLGGWSFTALAFFLALMSLLEFYALGHERGIQGNVIIGIPLLVILFIETISWQNAFLLVPLILLAAVIFTFLLETVRGTQPLSVRLGRTGVTLAGLVYAGFPAIFLTGIRALPDGLTWIMVIIFATWGTDTLAYLGGRMWGKTPLAPRISPKKTVEGAVTGMIFGFGAALLVLVVGGVVSPGSIALVVVMPPLAVLGDLFESWMKRYFHVGDSHIAGLNLIPGHGGVLDRTDSLIWVTTACYLFLLLTGN